MRHDILIPPESVQPIVKRYLGQFCAAQWSLLAAGMMDTDTQVAIVDMFTEIVRSVSTDALRTVLPLNVERKLRRGSRISGDVSADQETFKLRLGNSLLVSFAAALRVPPDKCKGVRKLTELVTRQISQTVNSAVYVAINSPVWPEDSSVFVSGCVSETRSVHLILSYASTFLQGFLGNLNTQYLGLCCQSKRAEFAPHKRSESPSQILEIEEPERCAASRSGKAKLSVPSVVEAVSDILVKLSDKTADRKGSSVRPLGPDVRSAATEINKIIINDLHCLISADDVSEESCSSRPHFNLGLILEHLRDFYSSPTSANGDHSSQRVRKTDFVKFARKMFEKKMANLKNHSNYFVSLVRGCGRSHPIRQEDGEDEYILPGVVPESPRANGDGYRLTSPPSVHFEVVERDVGRLFDKLNRPEPADRAKRTLENFISSRDVQSFSKLLTDKVFAHLTGCPTYRIPSAPPGKRLSHAVISVPGRTVDATQSYFSPEVLYVMTEDAVGMFLQQVLLWMKTEPSTLSDHSDKVCSALSDVEKLISDVLNSPDNRTVLPGSSQSVGYPAAPPRSLASPDAPSALDDPQDFKEDRIRTASVETSKLGCLHSQEPCPDETEEVSSVSSDTKSVSERSTDNVVVPLVLRILRKAPKESRKFIRTEDIVSIINRLTEKALAAARNNTCKLRKSKENMRKVNRAVIEDLGRDFGSTQKLLEAALNNPSFDDAAIKYLNIHLNDQEEVGGGHVLLPRWRH